MPSPLFSCCSCKKQLPFDKFSKNNSLESGRHYRCKDCQRAYNQSSAIAQSPVNRLYNTSKSNALSRHVEHSITKKDLHLPDVCPYLGVKLDYRHSLERETYKPFNMASIDRIDPLKGYVPGNVQVISDLANRMKSNADVEQLVAFAKGVLKRHAPELLK